MPDQIQLKPDECRVLGTLIEKAQTTPAQYPLTLNALTTGCNQKNNRHPVTSFDDDRVLDAIDGLRGKGLVREAMLSGSRVAKYRHVAREVFAIDTAQLVVLAELLLRGPQSLGEIRGNATRMHPLESLDSTKAVLESLITREPPLVKEVPPPPGSRARLYVQLVCPGLHAIEAGGASGAGDGEHDGGDAPERASTGASTQLAERVASLESTVARLEDQIRTIQSRLG